MTSQSPRIYLYKITFEEVPYYYYGVKKEEYYNQEYWGSPYTNKWCWELYTPKKQILQVFPYTDEGWLEAQEVEKRLIKPVFNTDKWCLNENCGGKISLEICGKNGIENGRKTYQEKTGIHGMSEYERNLAIKKGGMVAGKKNGKKLYEDKKGIHNRTKEQMSIDGFLGGKKCYEEKKGVHNRTKEQMSIDGFLGGKKCYEEKKGIHALSSEEKSEAGKIGGKLVSSQKWMCLETGFVTNPGNLTRYQNKRNIDTSKRIRIS